MVISSNSAEGCVQALIQYCKELVIQNVALEALVQRDVPDWTEQYNHERIKSQRTAGPAFHVLGDFARDGNWSLLQKTLEQEIDKLQR